MSIYTTKRRANSEIAFVWHIHQPFFIPDSELLWRVHSSYIPLFDAFVERHLYFSLSITGHTLLRIDSLCPGFTATLRDCITSGLCSLLTSPYSHPFLPWLSDYWIREQIHENNRVKKELEIPQQSILWPTELAWSWKLRSLLHSLKLEGIIVDSSARQLTQQLPQWGRGRLALTRKLQVPDDVNRVPRLKVSGSGSTGELDFYVREYDLGYCLAELAGDSEVKTEEWTTRFAMTIRRVAASSSSQSGPFILAEDVERILPNGMSGLLNILDSLDDCQVELIPLKEVTTSGGFRTVDYIPATTMETGGEMWLQSLDDEVFDQELRLVSTRAERVLQRQSYDGSFEADALRRDVLCLQDTGFYFWPYISRTRRPFYDLLARVKNRLDV